MGVVKTVSVAALLAMMGFGAVMLLNSSESAKAKGEVKKQEDSSSTTKASGPLLHDSKGDVPPSSSSSSSESSPVSSNALQPLQRFVVDTTDKLRGSTSTSSSEESTAAMKCPGTKAMGGVAAKCSMVYHFDNKCKNVKEEVEERIKHNDDPKSHKGHYELIEAKSSNTTTAGSRTAAKDRGEHKDLFTFTYTEHDINNGEHTHCTVTACSQSQTLSVYDFSTNFCNMYNLVCNKDQGCKKRSKDIHYLGATFKNCPFHSVDQCTR